MSKYGMGMLDDTIKKIQKRKMAMQEAGRGMQKASTPAKGAVAKAAPAATKKGKPVRRNEMNEVAKIRKVTQSVQKNPAQSAASKMSARERVAARVAAAKKKKGGLRQAAMK